MACHVGSASAPQAGEPGGEGDSAPCVSARESAVVELEDRAEVNNQIVVWSWNITGSRPRWPGSHAATGDGFWDVFCLQELWCGGFLWDSARVNLEREREALRPHRLFHFG